MRIVLLLRIFELVPFVFVFFLGSAIGSFLNVVVYRLPEGLSLLWPPSRCPRCEHQLGPTENIPIFGWLRLRGRCKNCKTAISSRYPWVETATALMFVLVFAQFGFEWQTLGYWLFFSWLLALALIDFDTLTLPHPLTQSGLVLGIVFQGAIATLVGNTADGIMSAVVGAVLGIWLLDLIGQAGYMLMGQDAMGGGDSKLAAMMGAWLGWKLLLLSGFLACLVGALVGVLGIASGRLGRRQAMPFGPFLALGAAVSALWGGTLIELYVNAFFPAI